MDKANDDLISRETALNIWCANCIITKFGKVCNRPCRDIERIKAVPSVDAAPVVRCKECKHRGTTDCDRTTSEWDDRLERWIVHDCTDGEGFCDYGAKMDGEE